MSTSTPGPLGAGLLIGDVARLAGITPRAVRHYHAVGLLPEPERDGSGYRRYGAADLVALVRVARLRALGMPVAQIRSRLARSADRSWSDELLALADELTGEIERLTGLRDQLEQAARAGSLDDPRETLAQALREHGRLGRNEDLPPGEAEAAGLVDALHPGGVAGAVDTAHDLLADPARAEVLGPLLQRYRALTDDGTDAEADALAADVAAVLPAPRHAPPPVDIEAMDALLGDRLNRAQRRFMRQLRRTWQEADG